MALRTGSPIFVSRELLDEVGLEPLETESDIDNAMDRFNQLEPQITGTSSDVDEVVAPETTIAEADELSAEPVQNDEPDREMDELGTLKAQLEKVRSLRGV